MVSAFEMVRGSKVLVFVILGGVLSLNDWVSAEHQLKIRLIGGDESKQQMRRKCRPEWGVHEVLTYLGSEQGCWFRLEYWSKNRQGKGS